MAACAHELVDQSALSAALDRYFNPELTDAEFLARYAPFSAGRELRRALRSAGPQGQTRGVWGRQASDLAARERRELEALKPGLVRDTRLRDLVEKSGTYARRLASRSGLLRTARKLLPNHRLRVCMQRIDTKRGPERDGAAVVEVVGRVERQPELGCEPRITSTAYRGVVTCGDGWACPYCAPRRTERNRELLQCGVAAWRSIGGSVALMTLTFSHGPRDELGAQWGRLSKAIQAFSRCSAMKRWRAAVGWAGRVRAREVTYGLNGWHPHSHSLEFIHVGPEPEQTIAIWRDELSAAWRKCTAAQGLEASLAHGFDLSVTRVDDYIAKWGLEAELAKWHLKTNRPDPDAPGEAGLFGYSPFDLLRIAAGEGEAHPRLNVTRERAGALFVHYAETVKGSAQLHWTRGLQNELELPDIHEHLDEQRSLSDEFSETLGVLSIEQWGVIRRSGRQLEFLALVQSGGFEWACVFLDKWRDEWADYRRMADRLAEQMRSVQYLWRGS